MKQMIGIACLLILTYRPATGEPLSEHKIPEDAVYVVFSSPVDINTVGGLINILLRAREEHPGKDVAILIDSPGGEIASGISAYNLIHNLERTVWTINTGQAESIGTVIYLAGDKRLCQPGAMFGFHSPQFNNPPTHLSLNAVSFMIGSLYRDQERIISIYKTRTRLNEGDCRGLFGSFMTWKDCAWAVKNGFADGISSPPPLIPDNATMVYWVQ